jgi:hypothetical protein
MTIEDFLANPTKDIKPIGGVIRVSKLSFGYMATQSIQFEYGYEFEVANLLGFDLEHLHQQMRTIWNIEPKVNQN